MPVSTKMPMGRTFGDLPNEVLQMILGYVVDETPLPATRADLKSLPHAVKKKLPLYCTIHPSAYSSFRSYDSVMAAFRLLYANFGLRSAFSLLLVDHRVRQAMLPVLKKRLGQLQSWRDKIEYSELERELWCENQESYEVGWGPMKEQSVLHKIVSKLEYPSRMWVTSIAPGPSWSVRAEIRLPIQY